MLQWTHPDGCSWNTVTCCAPAVEVYDPVVLLWARQSGCSVGSAYVYLCKIHADSSGPVDSTLHAFGIDNAALPHTFLKAEILLFLRQQQNARTVCHQAEAKQLQQE